LNPNKAEDPDYKAHIAARELSDNDLIETLRRYPDLLKKPILFNGKRAAIGYVPDRLETVVKAGS